MLSASKKKKKKRKRKFETFPLSLLPLFLSLSTSSFRYIHEDHFTITPQSNTKLSLFLSLLSLMQFLNPF